MRRAREKSPQNSEPILPTHPALSLMCVDKDRDVGEKLVRVEEVAISISMKMLSS